MSTVEDLLIEAYSNWDDAEILARTGRELQSRTRLAAAREVLARAVELRPDGDPDSWARLSFAQFRAGMTQEGLETLRRGVEATGSDDVRTALAGFTNDEAEAEALREVLAKSDRPSVRAELLAQRFFRGEAEALDEMRTLQDENPDDEDVGETVFWVMFRGHHMGAVEKDEVRRRTLDVLDAKSERHPDQLGPVVRKMMVLAALEDWEGILAETQQALERFPDEETLLQHRGRALRETGDHERAAAALNRAIGAKPSFAGARTDLGKTYEAMGRPDLAEEVFREIPVANPSYGGGRIALALFMVRQERWDDAELLFHECWDSMPAWMRSGLASNPDAAKLMERPNIKKALEASE